MAGVEAADVRGRIGLGVAQPLGLGQHLGEGAAGGLHLGQDVVAGAVEDAGDAHRPRRRPWPRAASSPPACRPSPPPRTAAATPVGLGQGGQLGAVLGDQRLVGGDHRLAEPQRGLDRALAGPSEPPISSTNMSMSGEAARATGSSNQGRSEISKPRWRERERAQTPVTAAAPAGRREVRPFGEELQQARRRRCPGRRRRCATVFAGSWRLTAPA